MEAGVGAAGPPRDGNGRERRGRRKKNAVSPAKATRRPSPRPNAETVPRSGLYTRAALRHNHPSVVSNLHDRPADAANTHAGNPDPSGLVARSRLLASSFPPPPNNQTTTAGFCNVCARVYCGYEPVTGGENPDGGCGSGRAPYPPYSSIPRASVNICSNSKSAISRAP